MSSLGKSPSEGRKTKEASASGQPGNGNGIGQRKNLAMSGVGSLPGPFRK